MSKQHHDAIVVGTGPGGATVAYELAKSGVRTLLVDKAKLPRYKTCGGGITYKAARALPFSIRPVTERVLYKADFSWKTQDSYVIESKKPLVYMVQRSRFDTLLTERAVQAGAQLMDETAVRKVEVDEMGATVTTTRGELKANYLVGADGATGRVARSLDLMSDRWALAAVESEVEPDEATMRYWQDKMGIDLGELCASYGWVFPKGDHLSVGVGGLPMIEDYGSHLKQYDRKHTVSRVPAVKRVIRSHGYLLPCRRAGAPVQKGRALLVGDAAGLVEAFTGEGIYWAIKSGQSAAHAILDAETKRADSQSPLLGYQQMLDEALMPDLLSARHWFRVYVSMPRACYSLPRRIPMFWRSVCRVMRGERRYRDIKQRLGPLGFVEGLLADPLLSARN